VDADLLDENAPPPPPAEWGKVIAATTDFLAGTGKDLTAAVRLTEALTKKHATAGLRDGLTLLTRLVADHWDHLHPPLGPEPTSDPPTHDQLAERFEDRLNRVSALYDAGKGLKFPLTVLRMPVVRSDRGEGFAAADWLDAARRAEIEGDLGSFTADGVRKAAAELAAAQTAHQAFAAVLDEKMGTEAPNLADDVPGGLGLAVAKCMEFVRGLAHAKGVPLDAAPAAAGDDEPTNGGATGGGGGPGAIGGGRDQLYRQLAQIADALKRIEPHSPIPYLLERCVRLGAMPFRELMQEVIRETNPLGELDLLLGLNREPPPG
jgi:type VI secretion system protein ImpA